MMMRQATMVATMLLLTSLMGCNGQAAKPKAGGNDQKVLNMTSATTATITIGGGCFWCVEAIYRELKGVFTVTSGYSGGSIRNPSYKEVCTGTTGHAEVVQIVYDPLVISTKDILEVFFSIHDPTTLNRQGADMGTQYRSVIFYHSAEQKQTAEDIILKLNTEKVWEQPVVTEVKPFTSFFKAEDYHQDYYNNNQDQAYCTLVIQPKLEKFEKVFKSKLK